MCEPLDDHGSAVLSSQSLDAAWVEDFDSPASTMSYIMPVS